MTEVIDVSEKCSEGVPFVKQYLPIVPLDLAFFQIIALRNHLLPYLEIQTVGHFDSKLSIEK